MLKLMREASHSYPWLLKSIMGVIALTFVITMGWWGFGEQTGTVLDADQQVEAPFRVRIALKSDEVQRRTTACVGEPVTAGREVIGELEVERDDRDIVANTNFHVGAKVQSVDEWSRFDMAAEIKLIRIC